MRYDFFDDKRERREFAAIVPGRLPENVPGVALDHHLYLDLLRKSLLLTPVKKPARSGLNLSRYAVLILHACGAMR